MKSCSSICRRLSRITAISAQFILSASSSCAASAKPSGRAMSVSYLLKIIGKRTCCGSSRASITSTVSGFSVCGPKFSGSSRFPSASVISHRGLSMPALFMAARRARRARSAAADSRRSSLADFSLAGATVSTLTVSPSIMISSKSDCASAATGANIPIAPMANVINVLYMPQI